MPLEEKGLRPVATMCVCEGRWRGKENGVGGREKKWKSRINQRIQSKNTARWESYYPKGKYKNNSWIRIICVEENTWVGLGTGKGGIQKKVSHWEQRSDAPWQQREPTLHYIGLNRLGGGRRWVSRAERGWNQRKWVRQHGGRLECILIISILSYKYISVLTKTLVKSATQTQTHTCTHTQSFCELIL